MIKRYIAEVSEKKRSIKKLV